VGGRRYDSIGEHYGRTRSADHRIVDRITELLNLSSSGPVLDVGAGTGNYSQALDSLGIATVAVEPSRRMRTQRPSRASLRWVAAVAESLPFRDAVFSGVICVLALHHFRNSAAALGEMIRVTDSGTIVLLVHDFEESEDLWLYDYFPFLTKSSASRYRPVSDIRTDLESAGAVHTAVVGFDLPRDLADHFTAACWSRPGEYLRPEVRRGMSTFALANPSLVEAGVARLSSDLQSGRWKALHGSIELRSSLDAGYRFVVAQAPGR
jgi:SAM-dependent methyltransferase